MPVVSSTGVSPPRSKGEEWSQRSESKPPIDMRDMLPEAEQHQYENEAPTLPAGERHSERRGSDSSASTKSSKSSKHYSYQPADYRPRQSPLPAEYPAPTIQQNPQPQQNHHNYRQSDFDSRRQVVFHQQSNLSPTRGNEQWSAATKPVCVCLPFKFSCCTLYKKAKEVVHCVVFCSF